jgi:hypothetical protein
MGTTLVGIDRIAFRKLRTFYPVSKLYHDELIDNVDIRRRFLLSTEKLAASAHIMPSLKTAQLERLRSQQSSFPEISINSAGKPDFHP